MDLNVLALLLVKKRNPGGGRDVGFLDGDLRGDGRADGPLEHRAFLRVSHIPNPS